MWKASYECDNGSLIVTSRHCKNKDVAVAVVRTTNGITAMFGTFPGDFQKGIIVKEYMDERGFVHSALTAEKQTVNHPCILAMLTSSRRIIGWLQIGGIIFQSAAA